MEKLLLKVNYTDETEKFWRDSYIKNSIVEQEKGETVHDTVKRAIEDIDGLRVSYKGKPMSTMYIGNGEVAGYIYRVQDEIEGRKALFDAWVDIKGVVDLELKELRLK